jgi:hypothetical protein
MRQRLLLLAVVAAAASFAAAFTDPAQNCTVTDAADSVCYGGPLNDTLGQIVSGSVPGTVAWSFESGG